ncbi:pyridoxine/pyridoxamine 5'-phosphate oxidase [Isoptericola jiangsuensis]|nr:pyridoxamine 5'-phosphate oxidase family protein [Isoptericola jiangsuensis]
MRERLRGLPVLPAGLPGWDVPDLAALPRTPHDLFEAWFVEAVGAGASAPHATTLSTVSVAGGARARTVLLTDLTAAGWWFAGHATSPKGRELAAEPRAALTFLWRETGRQVRVAGEVSSHPDAGAQDFRGRRPPSRAAGLVDHQSEVLDSLAEHRAAWSASLERVTADPDLVAPSWTAWCLDASDVEFWSTGDGTGQTRVRYRRTAAAWEPELLWP